MSVVNEDLLTQVDEMLFGHVIQGGREEAERGKSHRGQRDGVVHCFIESEFRHRCLAVPAVLVWTLEAGHQFLVPAFFQIGGLLVYAVEWRQNPCKEDVAKLLETGSDPFVNMLAPVFAVEVCQ
jgi:hypothetical protein